MKNFLRYVLLVCISVALSHLPVVHAQAITVTTPTEFTFVGVHTSCQLSVAGQEVLCGAGDGVWTSTNAGAWVCVPGTGTCAAGGTGTVTGVTINGTTKPGPTPSFTLSAAASAITAQ